MKQIKFEEEDPQNDAEKSLGDGEADPMAKRMILIERQNRRVMKLMSQLPRAPTPSIIEHPDGYAESPFMERISKVVLPKKLNFPVLIAIYDGSTDPGEHVAQYKQRMWQASIPWHLGEPCMCKCSGATLTGPTLKWLGSLMRGNINNFSSLINKFYDKFEGSRSLEKQTSDLYGVVQGPKESVRDYYNRFNKEMISIKDLDTKTAIECFRKGMILWSKLYNPLTKYPCQTFEEVKA